MGLADPVEQMTPAHLRGMQPIPAPVNQFLDHVRLEGLRPGNSWDWVAEAKALGFDPETL